MPLSGAYSANELAQRCARDEIEIDRLRAQLEEYRVISFNRGALLDELREMVGPKKFMEAVARLEKKSQ